MKLSEIIEKIDLLKMEELLILQIHMQQRTASQYQYACMDVDTKKGFMLSPTEINPKDNTFIYNNNKYVIIEINHNLKTIKCEILK